jgi:hypothetical protein
MTSSYDRLSILPIDANRRYSLLSMWFRDRIPVERLPYDSVWLTFGNWLNKMKNELSQGFRITLGDFCQSTAVGKQMGWTLCPEPTRITKCWNAAFHRNASDRKYDYLAGFFECLYSGLPILRGHAISPVKSSMQIRSGLE